MKKVYLVAAKRSAFGGYLGTLSKMNAVQLGTEVSKAVIKSAKIDPKNIDETIVGTILTGGLKPNVARQISIYSGVPQETPAHCINMLCGSGIKAMMAAFNSIKVGENNVILAGGIECMSSSAYVLPGKIRGGVKMGSMTAEDSMLYDGLVDAFSGQHMGITAENIAEKYEISRGEQDELALEAHLKAEKAIADGLFDEEIVPIEIKTRKGIIEFKENEHYRKGATIENFAKLRPAFKKDGSVTAGNASGINDGASMVILASEEAVKKYNLEPIAEIIATGQGGVDPAYMGMGPVPAVLNAVSKLDDIELKDMEYMEFNEAFASQALGVYKELSEKTGLSVEWFKNQSNHHGSAISLGHPVAATGPRIAMHVAYELRRRNLKYGLATMCIGGGMGVALILKKA